MSSPDSPLDRVAPPLSRYPPPGAPGDTAIVVPCFNEAAIVETSLTSLREWFPAALLVAIDDGSRDETWARLEAAAARVANVRVCRLPVNAGKGRAVQSARPLVAGRTVVVTDADLAYGRASIQGAIDALATADVAIGNRRHEASQYLVPVRLFGYLYRRHVLGHLFNRVVRLALGLTAVDTQCGLKAFRAGAFDEIMQRLETARFAYELEVLLLARSLGARVTEVPVEMRLDSARSSVRLVRDGFVALKEVAVLSARRMTGAYRRRASAAVARDLEREPSHAEGLTRGGGNGITKSS
jgi:glycosyltransferase involved in cell wall biosynthesis